MARTKHLSRSSRRERPSRYADGTAVPRELLAFVPPDPPVSYLGGRGHLYGLALQTFRELPTVEHAVLVTDLLRGVHDVRCFETERGLRLTDVAELVIAEIEDLPFDAHLIYMSRLATIQFSGPEQWSVLQHLHAEPPHLLDALIVSSKDGCVASLADRFGCERADPGRN